MVVKLQDLQINDYQKKVLAYIGTQHRTSYQIAAKLNKSYSSVNQTLGILHAMNLVKKIKKDSGGVIYMLSKEVEI